MTSNEMIRLPRKLKKNVGKELAKLNAQKSDIKTLTCVGKHRDGDLIWLNPVEMIFFRYRDRHKVARARNPK